MNASTLTARSPSADAADSSTQSAHQSDLLLPDLPPQTPRLDDSHPRQHLLSSSLPPIRTFRPGEPPFPPAAAQWREWYDGDGLFDDTIPIAYLGEPAPLLRPSLGLVCSGHCPGTILLETYRFARNLSPDGPTIIGGFHSPMERNCLDTLLVHHVPVVYCPGRRLKTRSVSLGWRSAIADRRLLLLSPFCEKQKRVDRNLARLRNVFVGALADTLFVPYARPDGAVASLVRMALERGKPVITLDDPENAEIARLGAEAVGVGDLLMRYKKKPEF